MRTPDARSVIIFGSHVCQDTDPRFLMRVLVGQTPRDLSSDDGHIIALDRKTACDLEASGQAVPVCATGGGFRNIAEFDLGNRAGQPLAHGRNMEKHQIRG